MASGDFDGDTYLVIYENKQIISAVSDDPIFTTEEESSGPGEENKSGVKEIDTLSGDISTDIFRGLLEQNSEQEIGVLSTAWLSHADLDPEGPRSMHCKNLSALISISLDSNKSGVRCVDKLADLGMTRPQFLEYKDNPVRPEYLFTDHRSKKRYLPSRSIAGLVHSRVQTREREMNEEDCSYLETELEGDEDYIYVGNRDTERYRKYFKDWAQYCEVLCY